MNQFFYETRGKEKVKSLMEEGMRSQALHRNESLKTRVLHKLPKLVLLLLSILGLLGFLAR